MPHLTFRYANTTACLFLRSRFVKRAMHGTRMLSWAEIRRTYGRDLVSLRNEGRWQFLNTLFSVSEAVMYMQVHCQ
jgi:5' nucleotidase family